MRHALPTVLLAWQFAVLTLGATSASVVGPFDTREECERVRAEAMAQAPDTVVKPVGLTRAMPGTVLRESSNPRFVACWYSER